MIIEGERLGLAFQKTVSIHLPKRRQGLDGTLHKVFEFTLERRGQGTVDRVNSCMDKAGNPEPRFDPAAVLALGKKIQGERLKGWAGKPLSRLTKGGAGRTGGHTGQSAIAEPIAYLKLTVGFGHFPVQHKPIPKISLAKALDQRQLTS